MINQTKLIPTILIVLLALAACDRLPELPEIVDSPPPAPPGDPGQTVPNQPAVLSPTAEKPSATEEVAGENPGDTVSGPAQIVHYDLGETMITQNAYTKDDALHEMPVRLSGTIGLPPGSGPFPLAVIMHGDHGGCPPDPQSGADRWPCGAEEEQPNYRGFDTLVQTLAARGTAAVSINVNGVFAGGYGDADQGERFGQIVDQHLNRLIEAAGGGQNEFGIDLYRQIDDGRLVWIGHAEGAELAAGMAAERRLDEAIGASFSGYGPLSGLLLVAPFLSEQDSLPPVDVPLAVVLPSCDGRAADLAGQNYYEAAREDTGRQAMAQSLLLYRANSNHFNAILPPEPDDGQPHPECDSALLSPSEQSGILADYSADFVDMLFAGADPARDAAARIGSAAAETVPAAVYGQPAPVIFAPAAQNEVRLVRPRSEAEITHNLLGGEGTAENVTVTYCAAGSTFSGFELAADACRRGTVNQPGDPAQLHLSWESPAAAWHQELPEGQQDISAFASVQFRAAPDTLSPLNTAEEGLSFSVRLSDAQGRSFAVPVPGGVPALTYPPGEILEGTDGPSFTGHVGMGSVRVPLAPFSGNVDLAQITEIALVFDQRQKGALFLADLSLLRERRFPGSSSTLLHNEGSLDRLRSTGRFLGTASCTATLIDTGAAEAPAVLITSGRCAQQWAPNEVNFDQPAGEMQMVFNYFANTQAVQVRAPVKRVLYSTMKCKDIALVELDTTLQSLLDRDIAPFVIAAAPLENGAEIEVIGAPLGSLRSDEAFLRRETCHVDGRVDLLESAWHFYDTYRVSCQDIYSGSEGAPVFAKESEEIAALVLSAAAGSRSPCTLNAPCEISEGGPGPAAGAGYATAIDGLGGCFDADGRFEIALPACPLDDGKQLSNRGAPQQALNPALDPLSRWQVSLGHELPFYRYKIGPAETTECRVDEGYGRVRAVEGYPVIDEPAPQIEGNYVLCLLAGDSAASDANWQQPQDATVLRLEIDTTAPRTAPSLTVEFDEEQVRLKALPNPPEIVSFLIKAGSLADSDCAEEEGYTVYGQPLVIQDAELPVLVCLIGRDAAGNESAPVRQIINVP